MDNIKSFTLDHDTMVPGFYCLGEIHNVYTYDLRFKYPNGGDYLSYAAIHSIEHLFATVIRNSAIKADVIYFYLESRKKKLKKLLLNVLKSA